MSDSTTILVEAGGPLTTVTFNRPYWMDGITNLMARMLDAALRAPQLTPR